MFSLSVRGEAGLCVIPFGLSSFRRTFRIPSAHSLLECRNVSTPGGIPPPPPHPLYFNIVFLSELKPCSNLQHKEKSHTRPLAKWLHQRASLVGPKRVCQNNTAWKTPQTRFEEGKKTTAKMPQRTFFFFSSQITLVRRPKDGAHRVTKRGGGEGGEGHQIVEFPIRSLAEIWNNNPHQGLATSVSDSIHWTMGRNRASHCVPRKSSRESFLSQVFHPRFIHTHCMERGC